MSLAGDDAVGILRKPDPRVVAIKARLTEIAAEQRRLVSMQVDAFTELRRLAVERDDLLEELHGLR